MESSSDVNLTNISFVVELTENNVDVDPDFSRSSEEFVVGPSYTCKEIHAQQYTRN